MKRKWFKYSGIAVFVAVMIGASGRVSAEEQVFNITIKDHHFTPSELSIPAGQRVKIIVQNQDAAAEEFESYELNREKVVSGNSQIVLFVGPLKPGLYSYFGEFHKDTAKGSIRASN